MKLKDWIDFNFNNEQFKNNIYRINVTVFNNKTPKNAILDTVVNVKNAYALFGEYELFEVDTYNTTISAMPLVRLVINKEEI